MGRKKKCCVWDCEETKTSFHELPSDRLMSKLWLKQLEHFINPTSFSEIPLVCGAHFEEDCFKDHTKFRRLKPGAIPTKFNLQIPTHSHFVNVNSPDLVYGLVPNFNWSDSKENVLDKNLSTLADGKLSDSEIIMLGEDQTGDLLNLIEDTRGSEKTHALSNDDIVKGGPNKDMSREANLVVEQPPNDEKEKSDQYVFNSVKFCSESGESDVCRICLKATSDSAKLISPHESKSVLYKEMLEYVLPDLNLNYYPDPVICHQCVGLLQHSYELKKKSLKTEDSLRKCIPRKKSIKGPINVIIVSKNHKRNVVGATTTQDGKLGLYEHNYAKSRGESPDDWTPSIENEITNCKERSEVECNEIVLQEEKRKEISVTNNKTKNPKHRKESSLKKKFIRSLKPIWGQPPYLCDTCGQVFDNLLRYRRHIQFHTLKKEQVESFTCDICHLTFRNINASQHMASHEQKQYKCEKCDRQFDRLHFKLKHMKGVHEKENYGQCHICGKTVQRHSVRRHLLKHNLNNKKYRCPICNDNKTFFKDGFSVHLKRHQGPDKCYAICYICGKMIYNYNGLRKHITAVHERKSYECELCNKKYTAKRTLKLHVHGYHGENGKKVRRTRKKKISVDHTYAVEEPKETVEIPEESEILTDVET